VRLWGGPFTPERALWSAHMGGKKKGAGGGGGMRGSMALRQKKRRGASASANSQGEKKEFQRGVNNRKGMETPFLEGRGGCRFLDWRRGKKKGSALGVGREECRPEKRGEGVGFNIMRVWGGGGKAVWYFSKGKKGRGGVIGEKKSVHM